MHQHQDSAVAGSIGENSGRGVEKSGGEGRSLEDQSMEAHVQKRLLQMWEETLAQVPEIMKAYVPPALFERFANKNRATALEYVAAIRRELESMWKSTMAEVPASFK